MKPTLHLSAPRLPSSEVPDPLVFRTKHPDGKAAQFPFLDESEFRLERPHIPNIGFVLYTKSYAPGTLNARWIYGNAYGGPGIATGGPKEGFAGHYHVRYFYDSGEFSDEYDLVIEKTKDSYKASWITKGKVAAIGVGMEVENGLAIGWRRVAD